MLCNSEKSVFNSCKASLDKKSCDASSDEDSPLASITSQHPALSVNLDNSFFTRHTSNERRPNSIDFSRFYKSDFAISHQSPQVLLYDNSEKLVKNN